MKQTKGLVLNNHVVTKSKVRPLGDGKLQMIPSRKLRLNNKLSKKTQQIWGERARITHLFYNEPDSK